MNIVRIGAGFNFEGIYNEVSFSRVSVSDWLPESP